MSSTLVSQLLNPANIDRAYPLVRNVASSVTLDRWARFARTLVSAKSSPWPHGLMSIQNEAGCILAFFSFEVRDDIRENRTLCLENIIIASFPGRSAIRAAVVDAAEQLARMHACSAIRAGLTDGLDLHDSDRRWLVSSFASAGYSLDGVRACKRLRPRRATNAH